MTAALVLKIALGDNTTSRQVACLYASYLTKQKKYINNTFINAKVRQKLLLYTYIFICYMLKIAPSVKSASFALMTFYEAPIEYYNNYNLFCIGLAHNEPQTLTEPM